jgi:hypothetical protein
MVIDLLCSLFLGIHYGKFYDDTQSGKLEHRLPFFGVLIPDQFKSKFPQKYKNFELNSQRLVTNYDFYEFLIDFTHLEQEEKNQRIKSGISLFDTIPNERNCESANIPSYVCICNKELHEIVSGWRECGNDPKTQQICDKNFQY